ncbi:MAG: phosphoglycerate dehydrogenase, partial [Lachnospiraceae bacterium]|nr:phosphoglycerate dehydrogenase [Lachnospiraceae bacterium]
EDNCAIMAVKQLMDYIENGNITNSVNYPACSLGVCQKAGRVAINHKNIPNMIGQITSVISACGLNISDMVNKSKGDYAYSLIDVEAPATQELYNKLKEIDGVIKVRIIK